VLIQSREIDGIKKEPKGLTRLVAKAKKSIGA